MVFHRSGERFITQHLCLQRSAQAFFPTFLVEASMCNVYAATSVQQAFASGCILWSLTGLVRVPSCTMSACIVLNEFICFVNDKQFPYGISGPASSVQAFTRAFCVWVSHRSGERFIRKHARLSSSFTHGSAAMLRDVSAQFRLHVAVLKNEPQRVCPRSQASGMLGPQRG